MSKVMAELAEISSLLKIANSPHLSRFLHDCVDDLTERKEANFDNYNSDIEWTINDFNKAKSSIQAFYRNCILNENYELKDTDLSANVQEEIKNCFDIRKEDIYEALVKEHITRSHSLVESIDWRLKWVLGSSKWAALSEPLLQVNLHCLSAKMNESHPRHTVDFETDLKQLNLLIDQLERASSQLKSNS